MRMKQKPAPAAGCSTPRRVVAAGVAALMLSQSVIAAAPPAGTIISNQAVVTYTDPSGAARSATSNTVETLVLQKAALTGGADVIKSVAPGGTAYLPYSITNSGNDSDTINVQVNTLSNATGTPTAGTCSVFLDANGDGQPDNPSSPMATGTCSGATGLTVSQAVPAGQSLKLVIAVPVSSSAVSGDAATVKLSATSTFDPTLTAVVNTDTVKVSTAAVFDVVKSVSQSTVAPSTGAACAPASAIAGIASAAAASCSKLTFTLDARNTGQATGSVTIKDIIGAGGTAGLTYIIGSGKWNGTALNDAVNTSATGSGAAGNVDYKFTSADGQIAVTLANVPASSAHRLSFDVIVRSDAKVGASSTTNVATIEPNGAACTPSACTTNPVTISVNQVAAVKANNSSTDSASVVTTVLKDGATGAGDNIAKAGAAITFSNVIWNTGNGSDAYNLAFGASTFPVGTTAKFVGPDGVTPVSGTTPAIPATATDAACNAAMGFVKDTTANRCGYVAKVAVTLPAGSGAVSGPLTQALTVTSVNTPSVTASLTDQLASITAGSVALGNDGSGTKSNMGATWTAGTAGTSAQAGKTIAFPVFIKADTQDTYKVDWMMQAGTASASMPAFSAGTGLPAGWAVDIRQSSDAACVTLGASQTSFTLNAAAGANPRADNVFTANQIACAVVSIPAGAKAQSIDLLVKATGLATGLASTTDVADRITVVDARSLAVIGTGVGEVAPGGTVVYPYLLSNTGNVDEGGTCSTVSFAADVNTVSGFSSVRYWDKNNNGLLDAADPLIAASSDIAAGGFYTDGSASVAGSLPVGKSIRVFEKVFAPSGAAAGATNVTKAAVTTANGASCTSVPPATAYVTATSTVVAGQIRVVMDQLLQSTCPAAATAPATSGYGKAQIQAKPGACVEYQVTATNDAINPVTGLKLISPAPAKTVYHGPTVPVCTTGTGAVANGVASCDVGTLAPGGQVQLRYRVQIDQ